MLQLEVSIQVANQQQSQPLPVHFQQTDAEGLDSGDYITRKYHGPD
jgi:hypothetical protein